MSNSNLFNQKQPKSSFFDKLKEQKKSGQFPGRPFFGGFESEIEDDSLDESMRAFERIERKESSRVPRQTERREFTIFAYTEYAERKRLEEEINKVREELYLAIKQMKSLDSSIKEAEKTIISPISNPGIYYVSFFEKLKTILQVLRQNIQESKSWLTMVFEKKRKRGYWQMAKKGGSTFLLSHERRSATQAS